MRKAFTLLLATTLIAGCGIVYRQPVFQGNLLETRSVEQLQVGLTRAQVFSLLGSPPVADPFNQARWDYVATERRRRGDTEIKNLTLWFDGDSLTRWEGEYFPEADAELAAEMRRFGNLARDKDKPRRPPSGG
ncbi:outer membrane protein assembly factor BamE [Arenimonas sp.]|uniref:outer membrane protein assembly factor BamE n=1 Tax=Arenimonas sp. TaxID=1872635 RepID=UPI0035AE02FB